MAARYDPLSANREFLGLNFVKRMEDVTHPVAIVQGQPISRHEFARRYGIANLGAARLITNKLKELELKDWLDFFGWTPADVAETPGLGITCVYCLLAVGHAEGVNTDDWLNNVTVTFTSLQLRIRKAHKIKSNGKRKRAQR